MALLLVWVLMGVVDTTNIAWQDQEVKLVRPEERARITGLSVAIFNLLAVPASVFGGLLWDNFSVLAPFIVIILIDGIVRMPIIYRYVPDGKLVILPVKDDKIRQ